MTLRHLLWLTWGWEPSVVLGCAVLLGAYLAAVGFRPSRAAATFGAGVLVLLLALVGPIDTLSDGYLFSIHMLQHVLLVLAVPPLLLLGLPPALARKALARPVLRGIQGVLGRPAVAWLLGMGTLWVWHLPTLYTAALESETVHIVEHLCFLTTATIFWWPVLTPLPERRLAPLAAVLYLLPASMASSLLGILFVFAPRIVYPFYVHPDDRLGLLPLLRGGWGLTPAVDQVLGGLIMWVPGCLVYLGVAIVPLLRWLSEDEGTPRVQARTVREALGGTEGGRIEGAQSQRDPVADRSGRRYRRACRAARGHKEMPWIET